jgi:hypothetical protein
VPSFVRATVTIVVGLLGGYLAAKAWTETP